MQAHHHAVAYMCASCWARLGSTAVGGSCCVCGCRVLSRGSRLTGCRAKVCYACISVPQSARLYFMMTWGIRAVHVLLSSGIARSNGNCDELPRLLARRLPHALMVVLRSALACAFVLISLWWLQLRLVRPVKWLHLPCCLQRHAHTGVHWA